MAYVRLSAARAAAHLASPRRTIARRLLTEQARDFDPDEQYDVFLSHSFDDAVIVYGAKRMIEAMGLTVYVDWIDDPQLDRSEVTVNTAALLRERMQACSSLVYAHSPAATHSVWMPWELGYFDGIRPKHVWVMPLVEAFDSEYRRQEYLRLYPAIENLGELTEGVTLGFSRVGDDKQRVLLMTAVEGDGIFRVPKSAR